MTPTLAVVMVLMGIAIGWMARGWDDLRRAKRAMKRQAPIQLNDSDLCMHNEMFLASPDGQKERERQRKLFDQLPDASVDFNGYFTDGREDSRG